MSITPNLDQHAGSLAGVVGKTLGVEMPLSVGKVPPRANRRVGTLGFCGLIVVWSAAYFLLSARHLGISLGILVAVCGLGWTLCSKDNLQRVLRCLGSPSVQAAILLLAGIPIAAVWCSSVDSHAPPQGLPGDVKAMADEPTMLLGKRRDACTDQGTTIPLYVRVEQSDTEAQEAEVARMLENNLPYLRLIKTSTEDDVCNCHGWVFTHGRYWVSRDDVPTILKENGYRAVEGPRAGDVIIYWNAKGEAVHTGLVQGVTSAGLVLVESKWGYLGRYIHAPEIQIYTQTWKFYRSSRKGHVLRGLEGKPDYRHDDSGVQSPAA